ncbi:NUDIX hydrolase [Thermoactinospora rubra]|uniref:NUDIX hydrolase n=1 Tax=Thermoactinospora rubra TaxID=1088767 RepID=UPI00197D2879|nr:NUDIX hydrolase [Thermoactinospora rubra]
MRVNCVGAIVVDGDRLLLVRRGRPPGQGLWSLPGGRVEPGESDEAALRREVREETGLLVEPGPFVGVVDRPGPGGVVYDIRDYRATVTGGVLAAGDDAADVRWCPLPDLVRLPLSEGLLDALAAWGITDRPTGSRSTG